MEKEIGNEDIDEIKREQEFQETFIVINREICRENNIEKEKYNDAD